MRHKRFTFEEYIDYRNKIVTRAKSRTLKFQDKGYNYYWIRLNEIDKQYPEFQSLGIIRLNNPEK